MQSIILATRNAGKVSEIISILSDLPVKIFSLSDLPEISEIAEDGSTFEENALLKARHVFHSVKIPALADDSGLEVISLGNRPGVYSARYAGENVSYEANNKKLLAELKGYPEEKRKARFRCTAAFVGPDVEHITQGVCSGVIINSPRGSNGFGYDPLFVPEGHRQTFAELTSDVKNSISHRSSAFRLMAAYLRVYLERMPRSSDSQ